MHLKKKKNAIGQDMRIQQKHFGGVQCTSARCICMYIQVNVPDV